MAAGDFVEVYSHPSQAAMFDAVATSFFLDTAHNIFEYMDVIYHTLKVCLPCRVALAVVRVFRFCERVRVRARACARGHARAWVYADACLPACLLAGWLVRLLACLPAYGLACLPACLPVCLSTCMLA